MTQQDKWFAFARSLMDQEIHEIQIDELDHEALQPYRGWFWIQVGHNSSHGFCVMRNADYTRFAVASSEYNPSENIDDCRIYRESSDLDTTLAGAYLGNKR